MQHSGWGVMLEVPAWHSHQWCASMCRLLDLPVVFKNPYFSRSVCHFAKAARLLAVIMAMAGQR